MDQATWFIIPTYCLVRMTISAKLLSNSTMRDKVMDWTETSVTEAYAQSFRIDCDLDL